ncbi:MAG: guanylate kinase [Planctomycetaceae bacterium]
MAAADEPGPFRVVVISGPSGAGKTTLVERVIREAPVRLVKSISATTRLPRAGEVEGEAYYFLTPEEFRARQARDEFLETAEVFSAGHWYGTLKSEVERARELGGWSLLEIDVQGALKVMELYPDAVTIFLMPPSWDTLEQRLRNRKTDAEATIQRRLTQAREELQFADRYRHRVVNRDLDEAVREVTKILSAQQS